MLSWQPNGLSWRSKGHLHKFIINFQLITTKSVCPGDGIWHHEPLSILGYYAQHITKFSFVWLLKFCIFPIHIILPKSTCPISSFTCPWPSGNGICWARGQVMVCCLIAPQNFCLYTQMNSISYLTMPRLWTSYITKTLLPPGKTLLCSMGFF